MPNWVKCGHVEPNEATECVTCVKLQRDRLRDMLNDVRGMAFSVAFTTTDKDYLAARILRRIEDGIVELPKCICDFEPNRCSAHTEKQPCKHKTAPTFDGLGVRLKCKLCNEWISED